MSIISYRNLDKKLDRRLKLTHRQSILIDIKKLLFVLEMLAKKRVTYELFIQSTPLKHSISISDISLKYRLTFVTLQEIENEVESLITGRKEFLPYIENRLTSYTEFKDRGEKLQKMIEAGKFDDYNHFTASEFLFGIMGSKGELLERLEIDVSTSYSRKIINQIIADRHFMHTRKRNLFDSISDPPKEETKAQSIKDKNPVPPFLRKNFKWARVLDNRSNNEIIKSK